MIKSLLHAFVAQPTIYNLVQRLVGADLIYRKISSQLPRLEPSTVFFDVAGGTGAAYQSLHLDSVQYVCLDIDPLKLTGFRQRFPAGQCVLGNATQLPIPSASVDIAIMVAMSHHLSNREFEEAVQEAIRVLKPQGKLIFLDAVWSSNNVVGKIMWGLDRGSNPRSEEQLQNILNSYGYNVYCETFSILHSYMLYIVTPPIK